VVNIVADLADVLRSREVELQRSFSRYEQDLRRGLPKGYGDDGVAWPILQKAGVRSVIMPDREKSNVLNAHNGVWGAKLLPLPMAQIGMEDAKPFSANSSAGRSVSTDNRKTRRRRTTVNNVVGDSRQRAGLDEWIS
jgi:hypothetical protein